MAETLIQSVTITNGQALSGIFSNSSGFCLGLEMPSAWTAADITFQGASSPTGTFVDIYDDAGVLVTAKASTSRLVSMVYAQAALQPYTYLKLKSTVNQGADRVIKVISKG